MGSPMTTQCQKVFNCQGNTYPKVAFAGQQQYETGLSLKPLHHFCDTEEDQNSGSDRINLMSSCNTELVNDTQRRWKNYTKKPILLSSMKD